MALNILIATDSFKGSASAVEVALALRNGLEASRPDYRIKSVILGDGGEGTLSALCASGQFEQRFIKKRDSAIQGKPFGWQAGTDSAYLESADFIGLHQPTIKAKGFFHRNSAALGNAIRYVAQFAPKKLMIGLGGTGTHDWGLGMADALGFRFLNGHGKRVEPYPGNVFEIQEILAPEKLAIPTSTQICWLVDIDTSLTGRDGAALEYAAQKGATHREINFLELGAHHLVSITSKRLGKNIATLPGSAAAGGIAFGGVSFLGGYIESGSAEILSALGVKDLLDECDIVITGEGRFDRQSHQGKLVGRMLELAAKAKKPAIIVSGAKPAGMVSRSKIFGIVSLENHASSIEESIKNARFLLQERVAPEIAKMLSALKAKIERKNQPNL